MPQHFRDSICRFNRLSINKNRSLATQRHFRRPHKSGRGATLGQIHVLSGFATYNYVAAAIPYDRWVWSSGHEINEGQGAISPDHCRKTVRRPEVHAKDS
jgi:hypothetical protein